VRYRAAHVDRTEARRVVQEALRIGTVTRCACETCGAFAHAHHDDYSRPLDVRWFCPRCHAPRDSSRRMRERLRESVRENSLRRPRTCRRTHPPKASCLSSPGRLPLAYSGGSVGLGGGSCKRTVVGPGNRPAILPLRVAHSPPPAPGQ
jgi:hypothetical protein